MVLIREWCTVVFDRKEHVLAPRVFVAIASSWESVGPPRPSISQHEEFISVAPPPLHYGPQEDRPFKAMRRVWGNKHLLDFFHVCPLLLHEKMGDGGDRPVHKFVFACPGRAAALVSARRGG